MRAPNGYGAVCHLGSKRRKPWAVRVTTGYKINDKGSLTPKVKYIGYYATRAEAFRERDRYNQEKGRQTNAERLITFDEVFQLYRESHFDEISEGTRALYITQYNKLGEFYQKPIRDINYMELQSFVSALSSASQRTIMKSVLKQVWSFAEKRDLVEKNIATGLEVGKKTKSTKHYKFSDGDVRKMWDHADDEVIAFTLMTIYSGMRPGELQKISERDVDLDDHVFIVRKGKTENAARKVPIHPKTEPLVRALMTGDEFLFSFGAETAWNMFIERRFEPALDAAGVLVYVHPETGQLQEHKPHDGRHTFTSRWKTQKLDEGMRRYIQGHSQNDIGGKVYTHYDLTDLREELSKLTF